MDCEKLDAMAIDLVYDELEARAAEEAEQHLLGCTRCSALVERLRAGKRASESLTLESPSSLLESRILEAASRARRPEPWPRRIGRAISTAGAYAMRPQVAMAAVVVVMVGMSVVLLRGGGLTAKRTAVTEEGTPVTSVEQTKDDQAPAVLAQSDKSEANKEPSSSVAAAPKEQEQGDFGSALDESAEKKKEAAPRKGAEDQDGKDMLAKNDHAGAAGGDVPADGEGGKGGAASGGAAAEGAKTKSPTSPPMAAATSTATAIGGPGQGPPPATVTAQTTASSPTFDDAMSAYTKGKYADAAKGFDAAAAAGTRTSTSLLYAARSQRALGSCFNAMPRFQRVLSDFPASAEVPWAAIEGGECARALGDVPTAKTLFEKAKGYPATKARAEANLAAMATPSAKAKPAKPSAVDTDL